MVEYRNCKEGTLTNIPSLRHHFIEATKASGATIDNQVERIFTPGQGYTLLLLLTESHASIHTYPEYNACFVDLFTCGDRCKYEPFHQFLTEYLAPTEVSYDVKTRGERPP